MNPLYAMIPNETNHEDYQNTSSYYLDNYLDNVFGYNNKNFKRLGHQRTKDSVVDKNTSYKTNNFGFRCEDWTDTCEILAVGCSNTYGLGVPAEGSWPNILGNMTDTKVRNFSRPGISIQELIFQLFAYFKIFGNPKTIVCLFPDPFRMVVPTKKDLVIVDKVNNENPFGTIHLDKNTNEKISDKKKYLKSPYSYEDFLPMEFPLFFSMKAIHLLEQYCNSNDIKLIWSSWYVDIIEVFGKIEALPFNNFLYDTNFVTNKKLYRSCHSGYEHTPDKYFDSGQDIEDGEEYAHPGVHRHLHIAEAFYREMTK